MAVTIKKYSNRRLYDTEQSRYITLEELAERIRGGSDVTVIDAKSGADLTQATLAQIILESRGAARLLPSELLMQLIRMRDDALAEFLGRYMSWALEVYQQMRASAQAVAPYNPFAAMPVPQALTRWFGASPWGGDQAAPPPPQPQAAPPEPPPADESTGPQRTSTSQEVAELRREIDELKKALQGQDKEQDK
jgi:polyhydroxyalkanoate synthesis repressor PhaR